MPLLTHTSGKILTASPGGITDAAFVAPTITPTYAPANGQSVSEGSEISVTFNTTGIPDNSEITFSITGVQAGDYSTTATSPLTIISNTTSASFIIDEDLTTEGTETFNISWSYSYEHPVDGTTTITGTPSWTIVDSSTTPVGETFVLGTNKASVDEGSSVTITLTTANVSAATTVGYTISGVTSADINSASLTGDFVTGTTDSVDIVISLDATTEGTENLVFTLDNGEDAITIPINDTSLNPTYSITASSSSVNEGDTFSVNLVTTDVPEGTAVGYTISGVSTADINNASLTGNFVILADTASLSVVVTADSTLSEGAETFQIVLDNGAGGTVQVTVNDTSVDTTPAYTSLTLQTATTVSEGAASTFRITGRNIATGTTLTATITSVSGTVSGSDFVPAAITRTITWNSALNNISQVQDFTLTLSNDEITEGPESYKVVLSATDSVGTSTGSLESPTVTIGDTSLTAVTGQHDFSSSGTWTVPAGVTKISILCIGAGGGGSGITSSGGYSGGAGAGGTLGYANNISVTPGEVLTATVGASGTAGVRNGSGGGTGGLSKLVNSSATTLCSANGGGGAAQGGAGGLASSTYTGTSGYSGGAGGAGLRFSRGGGGGGAGGYSGTGGTGQSGSSTSAGAAGSGGGGGGGGSTTTSPGISGGGGVGKLGQGVAGAGGLYNNDGGGGSGGEGGQDGVGGDYGGGGSGSNYTGNPSSGGAQAGGAGYVRVLYPGTSRQYPSTRTVNEAQVTGTYDTLIASDVSIQENTAEVNAARVIFTLSTTDVPEGTTVGYTITNVSGTVNDSDFLSRDSLFTVGADGSATVTMRADGDFATEGTESFKITLGATDSIGNDTESLQSPTVEISDDYVATVYNSISLDKSTYSEGETITITVNKTGNTSVSTTVSYTISASGTGDFNQSSGVLTMLNGYTYEGSPYSASKTIITPDLTTEGTETLTVTLAGTDSNGNATGGLSTTATILDSSQTPRIPGAGLVGFIDEPAYNASFGSGGNPTSTSTALADQDWGLHVGGTDDYIIVGAPAARDAAGAGGNTQVGQVFIYNAQNQNPINLIDSPYRSNSDLGERKSQFGSGVGIGEDSYGYLYAVAVCGNFKDSSTGLYDPRIIVYKSTNGFATITLHKIVTFGDPQSATSGLTTGRFQLSVHKDMCVIGTPSHGANNSGTLRYFQLSTSTTTTTVCQQTSGYEMGNCVDINADTGYVFGGGSSHDIQQGPTTYVNTGLAQVFTSSANQLIRTTIGRNFAGASTNYANFKFGCGIADAGAYYAVSSGGDDYTISGQGAFNDIGRIRFFQTSNGSLTGTVNNPIPYNSGSTGSGDYTATLLRGNHDGYVACVWRDAYAVQTPVTKVYNASNGTEIYSIASPGSSVVGLQTWTLEWGRAHHLTDQHLFLGATENQGFGIYRIYIY